MNSAIIAIGTELTDGQIINSNASSLSARLKGFGPRVLEHLVVPDERRLILQSFDRAAADADLIFITGGLGPTSDDFTRDVVAEWSGLPLEFHEPSWASVKERLSSRGYPVQEFQKQQCYFPAGSVVLGNSQGTANGFRLSVRGKWLIVLPGPPREIEAIWHDHLSAWLTELCAGLEPVVTKSWDTMGLGESQVAALVDPFVRGQGLEVGYRVHLPYVEFKLSYPKSEGSKFASLVAKVQETLAHVTVTRDGEDLAQVLGQRLAKEQELTLIDEVSGAFLLNRLLGPARSFLTAGNWTLRSSGPVSDQGLCLWLRRVDENTVRIGSRRNFQSREVIIESPHRSPLMSERRRQYFAEQALIEWSRP